MSGEIPKLTLTSDNIQLGRDGAHVKDNNGAVEIRNEADDNYQYLRCKPPVATNDAVTLTYFDTEIPNNSAVAANTAKNSYPSADATKLAGIEALAEVNNISDTNATDLTDGGETALHTHPNTGAGDVIGPASATDNAFARYDGTTGKLIKDAQTVEDDNGNVIAQGTFFTGSVTNRGFFIDASGSFRYGFGTSGTSLAIYCGLTSAQERIRIDSSGNVMIGTMAQVGAALLTVDGELFVDTNIVVGGTVDGRDVATDGTKLDGIEALAEVNNISDVNATALTDGGETALHSHPNTGDVVGPASAVDGNIAMFDGTTGKLIADSLYSQLSLGFSIAHYPLTTNPHAVTKTQVGLSNIENILDKINATAPPTATDDYNAGYRVGSVWLDYANKKTYRCVREAIGVAEWVETSNNISNTNATDLTDGNETTLHTHPASTPSTHAASHVNGTDDIQSATASQKGLATATQITKLDGIEAGSQVNDVLTQDEVINLLTTDTAAQKQAKIDAVPRRNAPGNSYYVTFQFADGAHTHVTALQFIEFQCTILITGNASDSSLSTTKSVTVDCTGISGIDSFTIHRCTQVTFSNMDIEQGDVLQKTVAFNACKRVLFDACYIHVATRVNNPDGVRMWFSVGTISNTYFEGLRYCIDALGASHMYSLNNDDTGTLPAYGLSAVQAATIGKGNTQPTGATADERTGSGGVIR